MFLKSYTSINNELKNETEIINANDLKNETGKTSVTQSLYRKYTIYGTFDSDVCSRRCKKIQPNKLFQKCICK